jgi:hypothetical protein
MHISDKCQKTRGYSRVYTWLIDDYPVGSLDTLVRQSRAMMSEDFFFTQLSKCLSLEPYSGYHSFFRLGLRGLSFNGFSANAFG